MHMVLETTSILPWGSTLYTTAVSLEMSDEPYIFPHLIAKNALDAHVWRPIGRDNIIAVDGDSSAATIESIIADWCHAAGYGDWCQSAAAIESITADWCHAVGNNQILDFRSIQI